MFNSLLSKVQVATLALSVPVQKAVKWWVTSAPQATVQAAPTPQQPASERADRTQKLSLKQLDRRKARRKTPKARILLDGLMQEVPVIESSFGGARVVLSTGVNVGDVIPLEVHTENRLQLCDAVVAWTTPIGENTVVAGLRL